LIQAHGQLRARRLVSHYLQHRRSFLAGIGVPAALVGQAGRYAAPSNSPAIHNFRSYLLSNVNIALNNANTPGEAKDALLRFQDSIITATGGFVTSLAKAGTPRVKNGASIAATYRSEVTKALNAYKDERQRLLALPTDDETAFEAGFQDIESAFS